MQLYLHMIYLYITENSIRLVRPHFGLINNDDILIFRYPYIILLGGASVYVLKNKYTSLFKVQKYSLCYVISLIAFGTVILFITLMQKNM